MAFCPSRPRGEKPKEEKRSLCSANSACLTFRTRPSAATSRRFSNQAGQAPDAILFNGGFFIPEILRQRVADMLENWYGKRPEIFENRDLDLAVASGAAYYSYVRSTGSGVLVRGGLPRVLLRWRSTTTPPSAWCHAARRKAIPSKWIAKTCSSSPTARWRFAC